MELRAYLAAVRARWIVVVLVTLVAVGVAGVANVTATPTYEARTTVFFNFIVDTGTGSLARGVLYSEGQVSSYAQLASSPLVLAPVIRRLGLRTTPAKLADVVDARAPINETLLVITVQDSSARRSVAIATAVANQVEVVADQVTPRLSGRPKAFNATAVTPAVTPTRAVYPYTTLNYLLGLVLGLLVGALLAIAIELRDPRLASRRQVAQATEAPLLGIFPSSARAGLRRRLPRFRRRRDVSDQSVEIRSNMTHLIRAKSLRSVAVTSVADPVAAAEAADGLATSLARAGVGVLLLDADVRTSTLADTLAERYGADARVGLSSVLAGGRHWSDAVHHCAGLPMSILPAGAPLADPAAQLGSPAMADLLEQLTGRFGLVLMNCPPVLGSAEALVLSHLADGTLVVTGRKSKRTRPLTEAVDALRLAGARLVGVVLAT